MEGNAFRQRSQAMDKIELPMRLHRGLLKTFGLLLVSAVFVAAGVWMVKMGYLSGYVCIPIFALGVVVFAIQLLPGCNYLELNEEGFVTCALFRRKRLVPWNTISHFGWVRLQSFPMIVYALRPEFVNPAQREKMAKYSMGGWDEGFGNFYAMKPEELVALMNVLASELGGRGSEAEQAG